MYTILNSFTTYIKYMKISIDFLAQCLSCLRMLFQGRDRRTLGLE